MSSNNVIVKFTDRDEDNIFHAALVDEDDPHGSPLAESVGFHKVDALVALLYKLDPVAFDDTYEVTISL